MNLHKALPILTGLGLLLASSCDKAPETDFTYSPTENPEAGEVIEFQNTSVDATTFEWTFGDGGFSSVENPTYIFAEAGSYDVNLTARNEAGDQPKTKTIIINEGTNLSFTIWDSTGTRLLTGAEVLLYDNETDWDNFDKPLLSLVADNEGTVLFKNMEPMIYYIWALLEETGGIWVSGGWTPAVPQNETSLFNVPCVWIADETKKSTHQYPEPVEFILRAQ
ncbi:MAG: PKD domain-containing protein [Bacteroides sp.]|nr:PKD domain-containing protein [Bacteroides sp.]